MELTITREIAFRLVEGAIRPQLDPNTGKIHEPEFAILERQRPEHRELTKRIREYLEEQVKWCGMRRRDEDAILGLGTALKMAAGLLTAQEVREGEQGGPVGSVRRAFQSLGATLLGEDLPASRSMRREERIAS